MSLEPSAVVRGPGNGEALAGLPGVAYLVRLSGEDTAGDVAAVEITLAPGAVGASPHVHHAHAEHFHVVSGVVTFDVGHEAKAFGVGTWISVPRELRHGFRNESDVEAVLLCVVTPAGYEGYFREVDRRVAAGDTPTSEDLAALRSAYATDTG